MDAVDLGQFGGGLARLQGVDRHLGFELRLVLVPSGWHWRLLSASLTKAWAAVQDRGSTSNGTRLVLPACAGVIRRIGQEGQSAQTSLPPSREGPTSGGGGVA